MSLIAPEVIAGWRSFTAPLEGVFAHAYLCVKGKVTVGLGNMIEPLSVALHLPWKRLDGTMASREEIEADFARVKSLPAGMLAHRYAGSHPLRLDDAAVDELVRRQLEANAAALTTRWPAFPSFPPAAQWALLSMAWAVGTGSKRPGLTSSEWPKLQAAVDAEDWKEAAEECAISTEGNAGVEPRNRAQRELFLRAAEGA